jgi:hypothetical protein
MTCLGLTRLPFSYKESKEVALHLIHWREKDAHSIRCAQFQLGRWGDYIGNNRQLLWRFGEQQERRVGPSWQHCSSTASFRQRDAYVIESNCRVVDSNEGGADIRHIRFLHARP